MDQPTPTGQNEPLAATPAATPGPPKRRRLRNILLILSGVTIALFLAVVFYPIDRGAEAKNLTDEALYELKNGHNETGEAYCRRALQLDPKNPDAHFLLGMALLQEHKQADAIGEFRQAIALNPDFKAAHHGLAHALALNSDLAEAEKEYQNLLKLDPGDAQVLAELQAVRNKAAASRRPSSSEASPKPTTGLIDQIIEGDRLIKQADDECGVTGYELFVDASKYCNCDPNSAIAKYRKGLELDWASAVGHAHLAVLLSNIGSHPDEAAEELRNAIRFDPQELEYHLDLASVLESGEHYDDAEQELKLILSHSEEKIRPLNQLGDISMKRGDTSRARDYYQQSCSQPKAPDDLEENDRLFACFNVQVHLPDLPSAGSSRAGESICDSIHILKSNQNTQSLPRGSQGCCCTAGESNMDCFRRCNESALPCP